MNGTILNIQRFCTDDGPGIRTTVFLKGCHLHCVWCHNPESQTSHCEVMFDIAKCVLCKRCGTVCSQKCHSFDENHKFEANSCISCGDCVKVCANGALEFYGKKATVDEVYEEIEKDKVFYETSSGGVTISGGDPLFQPEFTTALIRMCKANGIHTAIETSGFAKEKVFLQVVEHCDLVLFDIKETDDKLHKQYTGVALKSILRNLNILNEKKIPFIIRAPIIPTLNDRESHFKALKELCGSMEYCQGVQIMPYHKLGTYKYDMLNKKYICNEIPEPTKEMIAAWNKLLECNSCG